MCIYIYTRVHACTHTYRHTQKFAHASIHTSGYISLSLPLTQQCACCASLIKTHKAASNSTFLRIHQGTKYESRNQRMTKVPTSVPTAVITVLNMSISISSAQLETAPRNLNWKFTHAMPSESFVCIQTDSISHDNPDHYLSRSHRKSYWSKCSCLDSKHWPKCIYLGLSP